MDLPTLILLMISSTCGGFVAGFVLGVREMRKNLQQSEDELVKALEKLFEGGDA